MVAGDNGCFALVGVPPSDNVCLHGGFSTVNFSLLLLIKIYWLLWPKAQRRSCLFRISCSRYVY
jgi:hypothetical protein